MGESAHKGDIPKEDPPGYYDGDHKTMMRIVKRHQFLAQSGSEVASIVLSPQGTYLVVHLVSRLEQSRTVASMMWHVPSAKEINFKTFTTYSVWVNRGMVFAPAPDESAMLCSWSFTDMENVSQSRLDLYDLATRKRRTSIAKLSMTRPLAWSPDGAMVAGRRDSDSSKVITTSTGPTGWTLKGVIPGHMAAVTHVAFTPDSGGIVTMAKDGWIRLSSAATGRTAGKVRIQTRYDPTLMVVAADGKSVSTVWGRDVRIWSLETGGIQAYDLDDVRDSEGWPICISPDGKLLVCRTEGGFDISSIATGTFLAEVRGESSFYTSGVFTPDGCGLFLGKWSGVVELFNVFT